MDKTYCTACNNVITEDQTRWAFDEPYCDNCFDEGYLYCHRCDELVCRGDAYFDDDGNAYCSECWDEDFDDNSPNNPAVYNADREQIIELSRNWLLGKQCKKITIKINERDTHLIKLRDKVGLVEQPIYVFGLQDREEYQISASSNLMDFVKEYFLLNGLDWKVVEGVGCNRLGISLSLRQNNFSEIFNLIKHVSQLHLQEAAT